MDDQRWYRHSRWVRLVVTALAMFTVGAGLYVAVGGSTQRPATIQVLKDGVVTPIPEQSVVLLVDVSTTMLATDIRPTRLAATIAATQMLVNRLPARLEVGLVTFSTTAKIIQEPTRNRPLILQALRSLHREGASNLGDGLAAAVKLAVTSLAQDGIRRAPGNRLPAVIVLETDGNQDGNSLTPLQAARLAKAAGMTVDGVAVGTPKASFVFCGAGGVSCIGVGAPLHRQTVVGITRLTGGEVFTAGSANRLEAINRELGASLGR